MTVDAFFYVFELYVYIYFLTNKYLFNLWKYTNMKVQKIDEFKMKLLSKVRKLRINILYEKNDH